MCYVWLAKLKKLVVRLCFVSESSQVCLISAILYIMLIYQSCSLFPEKIADTERHIDVSKGHAVRAEDNADEIKKLNRSIFIPAITFNKDGKRLAQERKREMRYQEEVDEREQAMQDIRESQNRVGQGATFGTGGGRRQLTAIEEARRKEERKRYQFEATESDDEMENEIDDNLDEILDATKRMKALGLSMGSELQTQNQRLVRVTDKADRLGNKIDLNTHKVGFQYLAPTVVS